MWRWLSLVGPPDKLAGVKSVRIVDYDPKWPQLFASLEASISGALGDLAIRIEHVGSTAVPGLAAKPIIDIDVVVATDRVHDAIRQLASAGYAHEGDLGIFGREAFVSPDGLPTHHLYVCPVGSPELARHLRFRDYLRSDPSATAEYAALKRRLAATTDRAAYSPGKSEFIERALQSWKR